MTVHPATEARLATLIARYADQAPTFVDAVAMAQHASRTTNRSRRLTSPVRWALVALTAAALLTALAGAAFMAGRPPLRDPIRDLLATSVVEPYLGLPPVGAPTSVPDEGELVLAFEGRVLGNASFHRMWTYADGRLIWIEEGTTTGVVEQHLTDEGVDLLRGQVVDHGGIRSSEADARSAGRPGVLWGNLTVRAGDLPGSFRWSEPGLPGRITRPASWLPDRAWADDRLRGYVPARYALCDLGPPATTSPLPPATEAIIREHARSLGPVVDGTASDQACVRSVDLEAARAIVASLEAAGWHADPAAGHALQYERQRFTVLPMTPDGRVICACG